MGIRYGLAAVIATAAALLAAPGAGASQASFCDELRGQWDGQYCRTSVVSQRNAVRDIKVAIPAASFGEVSDQVIGGETYFSLPFNILTPDSGAALTVSQAAAA